MTAGKLFAQARKASPIKSHYYRLTRFSRFHAVGTAVLFVGSSFARLLMKQE